MLAFNHILVLLEFLFGNEICSTLPIFLFLCSAHDFTDKYNFFFLILLFNVDLISSTSALIVAGKVVDGLLVMRKIEVQVP